jgi:hypothetical protein
MTERSEIIQLVAAELSYHGRVANAFEVSAVLSAQIGRVSWPTCGKLADGQDISR